MAANQSVYTPIYHTYNLYCTKAYRSSHLQEPISSIGWHRPLPRPMRH